MTSIKRALQAAAGAATGEALYVEDVFSTYLYTGLYNWNIRQEVTTSAKTDNHFVIFSICANNLGTGNNTGTNENNYANSDFLMTSASGGGSADGTNTRRLITLHYTSSSSGQYIGRTLDTVDPTGEFFGYVATFNYGNATGVTEVNDYINFDFTSSGSDIQSGDLLLFVSMDTASATQSTLPSGFTEIFYENQAGTYGFAIRAAAKIADGTENGTDYGDTALLSASTYARGIILRKTGGSWDISEMVSSLAEETNTVQVGGLITNGIDLDVEGGLVWLKNRDAIQSHGLFDTERGNGASYFLSSDLTGAEYLDNGASMTFNSDGFRLGSATYFGGSGSGNAQDYASWTFRKAPKFFDVVTYTGDGSVQSVNHNLGSVPVCMIVKRTDSTGDWYVYHVDLGAGINGRKTLKLNSSAAQSDSGGFSDHPTDTAFTVNYAANTSGGTYVAYLFASDAGGFGDDENIIKCGSFNAAANTDVDLGFEPQWIMFKNTTNASNWQIVDMMRGMPVGSDDRQLMPNLSNAESDNGLTTITPTGFTWLPSASGNTYIYIAIRRPMKTPESGTEVFAIDTANSTGNAPPQYYSGFAVDFAFHRNNKNSIDDPQTRTRLTATGFYTNRTDAEWALGSAYFAYSDGYGTSTTVDSNDISWMFKRATGFFDVVAYTGDGTSSRDITHNLGAVPEFIVTKRRDTGAAWAVYHPDLGITSTSAIRLNSADGWGYSQLTRYPSTPTSTVYTIGNDSDVNTSSGTYVSYLFATLAGVSKVGSYTGTGADLNVDCGFSAGARWVMIKRYGTSTTGDWYVWDSERGIVAGNDPYLLLNSTAAEVTSTDYIDPLSSGFTVTSSAPAALNASGGTYIFLAIA